MSAYVGFDSIPRQIEKRLLRRGFQLNVMLVGQTGLGKSTLINTLFAAHLVNSKGRTSASEPPRKTVEIQATTHMMRENNVKLRLTVIDTPGYGDQINNDKCWDPIVRYIKDQHAIYLRKELTAARERNILDTRVHCVLFFISPSSKGLRDLDVIVLQKLSEVANVVPVIAKADSLVPDELTALKKRIRADFERHNIQLYPRQDADLDGDGVIEPEEHALNEAVKAALPFAVVGSEQTSVLGGREVRVRKTRYGVINIEDEAQCEFVHLRNFLTRTHLHDLVETTAAVHYEAFRTRQLMALKETSQRQ